VKTDSICFSTNVCKDSACTGTVKGTSGCVETPKPTTYCNQNTGTGGTNPVCSDQVCKDFEGCVALLKNCNGTNKKQECNTFECSEKTGSNQEPPGCQKVTRNCANLGVIVGAVVGAGAAVGIALGAAAFIALVTAGGAALGAATLVGNEQDHPVHNNPIFVQKTVGSAGLSGDVV
jgi:hypothetical protein